MSTLHRNTDGLIDLEISLRDTFFHSDVVPSASKTAQYLVLSLSLPAMPRSTTSTVAASCTTPKQSQNFVGEALGTIFADELQQRAAVAPVLFLESSMQMCAQQHSIKSICCYLGCVSDF